MKESKEWFRAMLTFPGTIRLSFGKKPDRKHMIPSRLQY